MAYNKTSEENEQIALFRWAEFAMNQHPELELMYHIPNEDKRSKFTGARLKAAGLKSGVPDICLPVARGGYIGLYIEMKAGKNKLTDNQEKWLNVLTREGNFTAVCYGWEKAKEVIEKYLSMEKTLIF